uniref:FCP1 homology domain-containing protein n=1 Tax=Entomoneis paludosa TaxID=265537 RepID=A0A7S2VC99_9STRA|mmetsp:Transcript_16454/g.33952  ORF Transcript_16454/g.33952 Transcript_16454/m.33952 type:complete len:197 (+) Transcript_16454:114-704(+)|eukprot:CAMPEP_0172439874 /NCGR_PEP_ID=MMETSP1065-20121228/724_1 /TAXON_ID=265537 /ORGANISM="Amphiprora paludosa, Strain CCMP125" /LENGTH=196 /DNA_ID=CAMNT_0013188627 /DNA_START=21 /DNA_END=611 /DNA_ORIENTATION=-
MTSTPKSSSGGSGGGSGVGVRVVIFLDMDGVMQPFGNDAPQEAVKKTDCLFPDCTLQALSYILEQVPTAELVLSSTWRVQHSYIEEIEQNFHAYGRKRHNTNNHPLWNLRFADITNPQLHSERQYEIQDWLEQQQQQSTTRSLVWIAIDDEDLIEGAPNARYRHWFQHHVVKTQSHVGLTASDAQLAVRLLKAQLD